VISYRRSSFTSGDRATQNGDKLPIVAT